MTIGAFAIIFVAHSCPVLHTTRASVAACCVVAGVTAPNTERAFTSAGALAVAESECVVLEAAAAAVR